MPQEMKHPFAHLHHVRYTGTATYADHNEYVAVIVWPDGLEVEELSVAECRNIGILTILNAAFPLLAPQPSPWRLVIATVDRPSACPGHKTTQYPTVVVQTVGARDTVELFPEYVFGNWWHIGLEDFDAFTRDIATASAGAGVQHRGKAFWAGNLAMHPARGAYQRLAQAHPEAFECFDMHWTTPSNSIPSRFVKLTEFHRWDYLVDLQAGGWSGRLVLLPFCARPLLVQDREWYSWANQLLIPGVHYLPFAADTEAMGPDLLAKVQWLREHPLEAQRMAEEAMRFARQYFTLQQAAERAAAVLQAVSARLF